MCKGDDKTHVLMNLSAYMDRGLALGRPRSDHWNAADRCRLVGLMARGSGTPPAIYPCCPMVRSPHTTAVGGIPATYCSPAPGPPAPYMPAGAVCGGIAANHGASSYPIGGVDGDRNGARAAAAAARGELDGVLSSLSLAAPHHFSDASLRVRSACSAPVEDGPGGSSTLRMPALRAAVGSAEDE